MVLERVKAMKGRVVLAWLVVMGAAAACAADAFPNDPYYVAGHQWYGSVLGLPTAWGISQGSPSVIVAVLDTGVMADTPDLAGRVLSPLSGTSSGPLDGTAKHHGTWVASVLAMGVNNGLGGAGVGNFSVLPVTVTNAAGNSSSDWIAAGIRQAADAGARVINVSQGTLNYGLLDNAAKDARAKGALVFVAAGNSGARNGMAACANLIFVSGTNSSDGLWSGSTYGPFVDLAAPAEDILVADPTFTGGYGLGTGTSYAAPLAAGAAALLWSIAPDLTPDEVQNILYTTADDLGTPGWDEVFGWGRLNIGAAAEEAYQLSLSPEPGTLLLVAAGLGVSLARRLRRRP
ncbi:MAG: S8 family serine peptidase [Planctomycetota bacterium]|nr:S8 family serine peptidase [Planctomycetota bacterium]